MSYFHSSHSSAPTDWKQGHWQQSRRPAAGRKWSRHRSFEQNDKCQLYFFFGHTAPQCAQFRSSGHQPSVHLPVGLVSAPTWFLDIGTNQHVTPNLVTLTKQG